MKNKYQIQLKHTRISGLHLQHLNKCQTEELCRIAVKQNGLALQYVVDEFKTDEIINLAVEQNSFSFEFVPGYMITYKLCCKAVSINGMILQFIPKYMMTDELYYKAVYQNGNALKYIDNPSDELCMISCKQDYSNICYIKKEISYDFLLKLIKLNGKTLNYIENYISKKITDKQFYNLYLEAMKQNVEYINYVYYYYNKQYNTNHIIRQIFFDIIEPIF